MSVFFLKLLELNLGEVKRGDASLRAITMLWLSKYRRITVIILLHEIFLEFVWLRAVVFQLNLKYLRVEITKLLLVVV